MIRNQFILVTLFLVLVIGAQAQKPAGNTDWKIRKVSEDSTICFALYTLHDNILKLTAQLYELDADADHMVRLEINNNGRWQEIARKEVETRGWTATFRIENWDSGKDQKYRLVHGKNAFFEGLVRRDPLEKEEIVVADFYW